MSLATVLPFRKGASVKADMVAALVGRRLIAGELNLRLPQGEEMRFVGPQPGPQASVHLKSARAFRRLLLGGEIGLAESYMDGDWETPDLVALLELGDINTPALGNTARGKWAARMMQRYRHWQNRNSREGSRRNVASHYDLGNGFYSQWLDPSMTYSAALFTPETRNLEEAQLAKYRAIAQDIDLQPGHRVLEIGCGWGGFAEMAARDYGAEVVGLTLSVEQKAWADARIAKAGLSEKVEIRLQDYRDVEGQFDRIVSIEMIEAVGERWWPTYFATLKRCLNEGGRALLQAITITDDRFESYRRGCDFIQRHIFPGGMLPSPQIITDIAGKVGLTATTMRCFGADYDRTLAHWTERFHERWDQIAPLGFDQQFKRLWEFYLAYCRAGFRTGAIDVCHVALDRK
jgi:cyclopropane-fatty-acyl-phospholipid synthase